MAKIYTGIGDDGKTYVIGGKRIPKSSPRVEAYGNIDELNSVIGICISFIEDNDVRDTLMSIQNELFIVGADLADPDMKSSTPRIDKDDVKKMERIIDMYEKEAGSLNYFILPTGSKEAALLHFARTVARRAERSIVELSEHEEMNRVLISYMNRLSSLLFVLARIMNKRKGVMDIPWKQ